MDQDITPANPYPVDRTVNQANPADYDGLVLPGGAVNPDRLRMNQAAMAFVRSFVEHDEPVAAICHGPWSLVETGIVKGRTVTSYPSLRTDIINAGWKLGRPAGLRRQRAGHQSQPQRPTGLRCQAGGRFRRGPTCGPACPGLTPGNSSDRRSIFRPPPGP
jgi:hypothetical protein